MKMRKFYKISLLLSVVFLLLILLSGCKVNWFDRTYDVPWYVVAIPVAVIFLIAHFHIMSGTYVCPDCGEEIKLKWYQIYAYLHAGGERFVICPNCKRKGFCKRKR